MVSIPCTRTYEKSIAISPRNDRRTTAEREAQVELMAERQANGLDIWTGKPVEGQEKEDEGQTV